MGSTPATKRTKRFRFPRISLKLKAERVQLSTAKLVCLLSSCGSGLRSRWGGFWQGPQGEHQADQQSDEWQDAEVGFFGRGWRGEIFFEVTVEAQIDIVGALDEAVFATLGAFESGLRHHGGVFSLKL